MGREKVRWDRHQGHLDLFMMFEILSENRPSKSIQFSLIYEQQDGCCAKL